MREGREVLIGARRPGKTTLVQTVRDRERRYLTLDDRAVSSFASADPVASRKLWRDPGQNGARLVNFSHFGSGLRVSYETAQRYAGNSLEAAGHRFVFGAVLYDGEEVIPY